MDRLRALEVFIAVAETGSFAGAGRALGISPPSVTRLVADLESSLGVALFRRTTRVVTLTDAGHAYLADVKKVAADLEAADDAVRGAHRAPVGLLRLTAPTMFGQFYVLPIVRAYLDAYPAVSVDAFFVDRIVNLLDEGVDVAVRIGDLPDSSMIAARVGEVRRSVCGHPDYLDRRGRPRTPEALKDHAIIGAGSAPMTAEWSFVGGASVRLTPRLMCSSIPATIAAAADGWGLTRVLSYQIGPELGSGGLEVVLCGFEPAPLPVHVVRLDGRRPPAKVRAFFDMAVEALRRDAFLNPDPG